MTLVGSGLAVHGVEQGRASDYEGSNYKPPDA